MSGGYVWLEVAQERADEVLNQDLVTAACVALIIASVLWVVLSRLTLRNLRRGANVPTSTKKAKRDLWSAPPEPPRRDRRTSL
jgi:branched-subunit amino acid ABC-type transport system permease component